MAGFNVFKDGAWAPTSTPTPPPPPTPDPGSLSYIIDPPTTRAELFGGRFTFNRAFRQDIVGLPQLMTNEFFGEGSGTFTNMSALRNALDELDNPDFPTTRLDLALALVPKGGTVAKLLAGDYDTQWKDIFTEIRTHITQAQRDRLWIRLGWEFNGDWYSWGFGDSPSGDIAAAQEYALGWKHVRQLSWHATEGSGGGEKWFWCASGGGLLQADSRLKVRNAFPQPDATSAAQGDNYAHALGMDIYAEHQYGNTASSASGYGAGWDLAFSKAWTWMKELTEEFSDVDTYPFLKYKYLMSIGEIAAGYKLKNGIQLASDDYPDWWSGVFEEGIAPQLNSTLAAIGHFNIFDVNRHYTVDEGLPYTPPQSFYAMYSQGPWPPGQSTILVGAIGFDGSVPLRAGDAFKVAGWTGAFRSNFPLEAARFRDLITDVI